MSWLKFNTGSAPTTPASGKATAYVDSADKLAKIIDDNATIRTFAQNALASIVAASAAINTVETIIVGGLNAARIYANQLKVGTTIRITLQGTCTSSAANISTWRVRLGTAGTVADGIAGSAANSVAAATGTAIPFECTIVLTVRTIGAAGTISGYMKLVNTGVTGISAVATQIVQLTPTAINTTVDNWIEATYQAAAATTTSTFQVAAIEVTKV